jgi:hypothetical protein
MGFYQEKSINHGILRLINSFLYSRQEKTAIACNVLKIFSAFINYGPTFIDYIAGEIPEALVKILYEENSNKNVIKICLKVANHLVSCSHIDIQSVSSKFVRCGICEAIMFIMEIHPHDEEMIRKLLSIIGNIVLEGENIPRFITAGLLNALVAVLIF